MIVRVSYCRAAISIVISPLDLSESDAITLSDTGVRIRLSAVFIESDSVFERAAYSSDAVLGAVTSLRYQESLAGCLPAA